MGIKGLNKWLHSTGASQDLSKNSPLSNIRTDHLLIDINATLHQAYEATDPSFNRTVERTLQKLEQVIRKFKPHKSLTIVFDGFAPLAKLQTQKERRSSYAIVENEYNLGRAANSSDTGATDRILSQGEITAGSPYLLRVEEAVVYHVTKKWMMKNTTEATTKEENNETSGDASKIEKETQEEKEVKTSSATEEGEDKNKPFLPPNIDFFLSPSTLIGEGEVKISQRLQFLADNAETTKTSDEESNNKNAHREQQSSSSSSTTTTTPHVDDNIVIFGSDSDLALVALLAVKFHNIWVVHPSMGQGTSIGFLLLKWMDSRRSIDELTIEQMPSVRIDFVFLMLLAGGDFYTGIDSEEAMKLWNRYRSKRSSPHGFHQRLIIIPSEDEASKKNNNNEPQNIVVSSAPPAVAAAASAETSSTTPAVKKNTPPSCFSPIYHQSQPRINADFFKQIMGSGSSSNHDEHMNYVNGSGRNNRRYQPSKGKTPNQRMKNANNSNRRNNGNAGQGANVCSFALWSLEHLMMGRCEALGVAPSATINGENVSLASIQAFSRDSSAVTSCRPRRTAIQGLSSCIGVERPPLFTFVAVCSRPAHLPPYVQKVLEENPQLRAKLFKKQSTTAALVEHADSVLDLTRAYVAGNMKQFTPEQQMEIQTLLMISPDASNCGVEIVVNSNNNKNVVTNTNNNDTIKNKNQISILKHGDELVKVATRNWKFKYEVGTEIRFRGIDNNKNKTMKDIVLNIVDKTKKKNEKKKDEDEADEEMEEEEECCYDDE